MFQIGIVIVNSIIIIIIIISILLLVVVVIFMTVIDYLLIDLTVRSIIVVEVHYELDIGVLVVRVIYIHFQSLLIIVYLDLIVNRC